MLCHRPPLVPEDGSSIAAGSIITGLLEAGVEVEVMSAETDRHRSCTDSVSDLALATRYETWYADTRVTPLRAARGLAQESYNVQRFDAAAGRDAVRRRLRSTTFDVVVLDSLFSTPYLPVVREGSDAAVILRAQNIEHHLWEQFAGNSRGPRATYFRHLSRQLRRYESRIFRAVDGIAAISADDLEAAVRMAPDVPVGLVEIGVANRYQPVPLPTGAPLCSIASYDWQPNVEGMQWFLDEVWPLVRHQDPEARLDIAGRHADRYGERFARPGVRVVGPVDSASEFLADRGVMVAPLRSSSGIRVKLVESMLLGKPIVTTPAGARGLYADPDWPMLVRDDAGGFAAGVLGLMRDHQTAQAMGTAARQAAELRFSPSSVTGALLHLIDTAKQNLARGANGFRQEGR